MLSGKGCGISKTTRMLAQKQPFIQRVRNSSLVERSCAENVPGLKHNTEAEACVRFTWHLGRGAFLKGRSCTERSSGLLRRENAGMSSEMKVRILQAEYLRFPG